MFNSHHWGHLQEFIPNFLGTELNPDYTLVVLPVDYFPTQFFALSNSRQLLLWGF